MGKHASDQTSTGNPDYVGRHQADDTDQGDPAPAAPGIVSRLRTARILQRPSRRIRKDEN